MELKITLPPPPSVLSPNARAHWAVKSKATKRYREDAKLAAIDARNKAGHLKPWTRATVKAVFYFSTRRRRDRDNLLASLKAAMDGLADAGVVTNDSGFTYLPVECIVSRWPKPCVVLTVKEG